MDYQAHSVLVRKGVRPIVPCHHIREYRFVYGAVEPETGDSCYWVMTRCDNESMFPPYTPETNPIEQIWKEIRKRGFRNEIFGSLEAVIDREGLGNPEDEAAGIISSPAKPDFSWYYKKSRAFLRHRATRCCADIQREYS